MATGERGPTRILIVEDEQHLALLLQMNLELEGYRIELASTGRQARQAMAVSGPFDLVILDVMLPDANGMDLCSGWRAQDMRGPILMLTALGQTEDRVEGLNAGADDYLAKPFALPELLARVSALLRRSRWADSPRAVLKFGQAAVDFEAREASAHGAPVELTRLEFDLLRYFSERPGKAIAREVLLEEVWGVAGSNTTRTVDNFVMRLRRHFESQPSRPRHFVSVRGVGYKFMP